MSAMQRARRLALVAVLALVGGLALAGCRSQPGAAIYVGSTRYSEKQVDKLADELKDIPSVGGQGNARHTIAEWIVSRDAARILVADKNWSAPKVDLQATAQQTGLRPDDPLTRLFAEYVAYNDVIQQHAAAVTPSDADWTDLYQRAVGAGLVKAGTPESQFRQSLGQQDQQVFTANLGLRDLYREAIKKANVSVNPKYGSELGLLRDNSNHTLVAIPFNANGSQSAVVPAPASTGASSDS